MLVICFFPSALLFNEVKYISTLMDLQRLENSLKGQSDLAFAYVQAVGTAGNPTALVSIPKAFYHSWAAAFVIFFALN